MWRRKLLRGDGGGPSEGLLLDGLELFVHDLPEVAAARSAAAARTRAKGELVATRGAVTDDLSEVAIGESFTQADDHAPFLLLKMISAFN